MVDVPVGKKVNGFTGELEDVAPLVLAPSPTDQRILAAPPNDADPTVPGDIGTPLIDLVRERVASDTARNVGGAYMAVQETPVTDITSKPEVQGVDVPPTNTQLVEAGHPVAAIELPDVPTAAVSPNAIPQQEDTPPQAPTEATPQPGSEPVDGGQPTVNTQPEGETIPVEGGTAG